MDRKREIVDGLCFDWQVSIRRACDALRFDRSSYHYKSRRLDPVFLKKRIKEIAETRVRYGYRRIHYVLTREGWEVNLKRVYRIYKELGLQLRNSEPVNANGSREQANAEASRKSQAARGSSGCGSYQRCLVYGLRS